MWCLLARVVAWGWWVGVGGGGRWMPLTSCEEATVIGAYNTPSYSSSHGARYARGVDGDGGGGGS